jgi:hypothetical protein
VKELYQPDRQVHSGINAHMVPHRKYPEYAFSGGRDTSMHVQHVLVHIFDDEGPCSRELGPHSIQELRIAGAGRQV